MGEGRGAYRILMCKPKGKRSLGRPKQRWEVNIKMYIPEIVCGDVYWIDLAQDRDR
jgi:hypothetical protein